MSADLLSGLTFYLIHAVYFHQTHLFVSRSNEHLSGQYPVAGNRLFYRHLALVVQPVGIHLRKSRRHMLHNHNSRNILPELAHHVKNGFCSSGGGSNGDKHIALQICPVVYRKCLRTFHSSYFYRGRNLYFGSQFLSQKRTDFIPVYGTWFTDKIYRPCFHGVKYLFIHSADDYHRQWILGQQFSQKFDSAHTGHLHIQRHNIRTILKDCIPRRISVSGLSHHFYGRILAQTLYQQITKQHRIIYY